LADQGLVRARWPGSGRGQVIIRDRISDKINMIQKGSSTESMITQNTLELYCNGRGVSKKCYVMNIDQYDFVIGMDLFSSFGFALSGRKMPWHIPKEIAWVPMSEKESIVPENNIPVTIQVRSRLDDLLLIWCSGEKVQGRWRAGAGEWGGLGLVFKVF
jgi:hypothetical protein